MIHIKCDFLGDEFTEYNIPNEELYDGQNASLIHFSVYTYQKYVKHTVYLNMVQLYAEYVKKMTT